MKKTLLSLAATLIAVTAFAYTAQAGFKIVLPVFLGNGYFQGAYGSVRNSADNAQYLFCWDFGGSGQCGARDAQGVTRSCSTTNPVHLSTIRGMDDTSFIRVYHDATGACTRIQSLTYSATEPKLP